MANNMHTAIRTTKRNDSGSQWLKAKNP